VRGSEGKGREREWKGRTGPSERKGEEGREFGLQRKKERGKTG
jgi:hypothetical protein